MRPGTVSSTSPARITGRASSCAAVTAPWLAAAAIPTRFAAGSSTSATFRKLPAAVTMTSALSDSVSTTSAVDRCAVRDAHGPSQHTEVEQPKCELGVAWWHIVESIDPHVVRGRRQLARVDNEIDRNARKRGTGLIEHPAAHATRRLRVCVDGDAQKYRRENCCYPEAHRASRASSRV